jgi:hypothetical protein
MKKINALLSLVDPAFPLLKKEKKAKAKINYVLAVME